MALRIRGVAIALLACAAGLGCPTGDGVSAKLEVSVEPSSLPADGSAAVVTIQAVDARGEPAEGEIDVTVSHGTLNAKGYQTWGKLGGGRLKLTLQCDKSQDVLCSGAQVVRASCGLVTGYATVEFTP